MIDAAFPEETRVAVLNEKNVLQNMDREISSIKQLKGNIYLAKVIRVEPSLQSAFINYGGDRHGFLPLSDIHPDYFNIAEEEKTDLNAVKFFVEVEKEYSMETDEPQEATEEDFSEENFLPLDEQGEPIMDGVDDNPEISDAEEEKISNPAGFYPEIDEAREEVEGDERHDFKKYKIEDVIKEGQCLLVQVLKEERGNKGVALTTYISLAGKYSVLMANVEGKGGISKKITNIRDRKILKNILNTINPDGRKSVIIRTAGIGKKPEEILRDYVYLIRLWSVIKRVSAESTAPCFIHSEDDLLKKTLRDLCDDRVKEIMVEGSDAYKTIRSLVRIIIPEQKIAVREYTGNLPLFNKYNIEEQLENLYNNRVNLPSGGSLVIDQTEALVAVDVNSGKSTREKTIEETALATNIEAAKELVRQLKLRDIGGLIVVDFIDMLESKNRRTIERVLKEELRSDKAKTQVEKISQLGLLEMSRQRVNSGLYERVNEPCPNCEGHGTVRSKYLVANNILRAIKYTTRERFVNVVNVLANPQIIEFMSNYRRSEIAEIENSYDIHIILSPDFAKKTNEFDIRRRDSLTEEEERDLCPKHLLGKINAMFGDDSFFYSTEGEEFEINFNDNCYYDRNISSRKLNGGNETDRNGGNGKNGRGGRNGKGSRSNKEEFDGDTNNVGSRRGRGRGSVNDRGNPNSSSAAGRQNQNGNGKRRGSNSNKSANGKNRKVGMWGKILGLFGRKK